MFQISTSAVSWECSCSVPLLGKFGEILGTVQAHFKCSKCCSFPGMCLQCSQNFPKFSQSGTLQEHSQNTANVLIWNILGTLLWLFSKFPSPVHCDHTDGNTAKSLQMSHLGTSLVLSLANLKVYPQFT